MPLQDAEIAVTAAVAGASAIRDLHNQDLQLIRKGPNDFATKADLASEERILAIIRKERPHDSINAEESGTSAPSDSSNGRVWLVDPLCGTANYIANTEDIAVNVALQDKQGNTLAAAVAHPLSGEILWTDGNCAYARRNGIDTALNPSEQREANTLVEVNFYGAQENGRIVRLPMMPAFQKRFHMRVYSTTLTVPWVAAERRIAYISEGNMKNDLHFAAGIAICQAAGCIVTNIDGLPLYTGAGGVLIAADAETHSVLVDMLHKAHHLS